MPKAPIKKKIKESTIAVRKIMESNLAKIADDIIEKVLRNARKLPQSKRLDSIKDVKASFISDYKKELKTAMAVIALDSVQQAKKEVPNGAIKFVEAIESIKLGEFEELDPSIRKRIQSRLDLLVGTQLNDLEKNIFFQFTSSVNSTDSLDTVKQDVQESAEDFITGPSIAAGSGVVASTIVNEARQAYFFQKETLEQIEAFEFVNEDPISKVCEDLAGTVFRKDDPGFSRYNPPLHYNCKSWIRPILLGKLGNVEITQLKPSTKRIEDTIQLSDQCCHCHFDLIVEN